MGVDRLFHLVRALAAAPAAPLHGHPRPHSLVRLTLPSTARMRRVAVSCSASGPADEEGMTTRAPAWTSTPTLSWCAASASWPPGLASAASTPTVRF
ncbi:hypothetical protein ZWY2020_046553 [Hordeum vulgare]|nr:hypothetical protein ZWY2020_046553 [Hordeum vulgare]